MSASFLDFMLRKHSSSSSLSLVTGASSVSRRFLLFLGRLVLVRTSATGESS